MSSPCVCKINGYNVKDKTARTSIEELKTKKADETSVAERFTEMQTKVNQIEQKVNYTSPESATGISYDNTESKLTSDTVQGAIDEINSRLLWKELANNKLEVDISNLEYKELLIMFHIPENNAFTNVLTIHILGKITETEPRYYNTGYYMNENENCGIRVAVSATRITHNKACLNGGGTIPSMFVYYR